MFTAGAAKLHTGTPVNRSLLRSRLPSPVVGLPSERAASLPARSFSPNEEHFATFVHRESQMLSTLSHPALESAGCVRADRLRFLSNTPQHLRSMALEKIRTSTGTCGYSEEIMWHNPQCRWRTTAAARSKLKNSKSQRGKSQFPRHSPNVSTDLGLAGRFAEVSTRDSRGSCAGLSGRSLLILYVK